MKPMDWFTVITSLVALALGYIGARGELQRLLRRRKLPRLLKEEAFLERMHASPSAQTLYLLESLLIVAALAGAGVMFTAIVALPDEKKAAFEALQAWFFGGTVYLFSLYRLGRLLNATTRFDKTIALVRADIAKCRRPEDDVDK
jgi:hypothetical protein